MRDTKRYCPMGDLRSKCHRDTDGQGAQIVSRLALSTGRSATPNVTRLSVKYNSPMTNEEMCRTWPGAHIGVVPYDKPPRWIHAAAPRPRLLPDPCRLAA